MKKALLIGLVGIIFLMGIISTEAITQNWKTVANNLVIDYRGKIVSIEQLNSITCWAVLSPDLSNFECIETAENIGYYIRNSTGGIRGERPSVHVFRAGWHIAVARPDGIKYIGELNIQDWNPSAFGGEYKP